MPHNTEHREYDLSKPDFWDALSIPEIRMQVARIKSIQTKRAKALATRAQVDPDEIEWAKRTNNLLASIITTAESALSVKLSEPGASESSQAIAPLAPAPSYATNGYAPPSLVWKITPETLEYVTFAYGGSTSQKGVPPAVTLSMYTSPEIPFDRLTFIYLWNMWELETSRVVPEALHRPRNAVDIHRVAITISKVGGAARVCSTPGMWKAVAYQLQLLDSQNQDDHDARQVVEVLRGMQQRLLGPFEKFCVLWSRLPTQEKNKRALMHVSKFRYPSVYDTPESPTSTSPQSRPDVVSALQHNAAIGQKIDSLLKDFCPGESFQAKMHRLITHPGPGEKVDQEWEKERAKWINLIRTCLEDYTPGLVPTQEPVQQAVMFDSTNGLSHAAFDKRVAANNLENRPFSPEEGLFPPDAVLRANGVVREAMRTVEEASEFYQPRRSSTSANL